jgi:YVTN family beta-propeller protein
VLPISRPLAALVAIVSTTLLLAPSARAGRPRPAHEPIGHLTFTSPQSNPLALSPDGKFLYVANTANNSVAVINTATRVFEKQIAVGLEPVSVAVRPGGREVWVANHVSDSISVIDTDPTSPSYRQVVETIQDLRPDGATRFDEPVGVAFASDAKAYVALSSRNQVAVVDAASYAVTGSLNIRAQEPRAIAVRNGRLYVAAFESGNQSELSACGLAGTAPQCTIFLTDLNTFATSPNMPGFEKNIVIDPQVPDRDLFVFDTSTDDEIKVVEGVGTLLYGLAVDAGNRVYLTQTDARNAVNGTTSGLVGDVNGDGDVNLADLENRMFTNEVAILDCGVGGPSCSVVSTVDLDPSFPDPATALATPYGIALSGEPDPTIVATAAASSRLFTMDSSGNLLAQLDVGAIPRGVALRSDPDTGAPQIAYVLNTLDTTVTVVDVSEPAGLSPSKILATILVGIDPTPQAVRLGRIAFNDASASTSGTFACASCHPDGHTDQLLWRIGGECFLNGCVAGEDEIRSTMPIRGLRDSVPLHWDGILGDPFGGPNGATGSGGNPGTSCSADPHTCFRDLVDASLAGVMCDQAGACPPGGTILSEQEKDDMATFLERVSYPPARSRRIDDSVSTIGEGVVVTDPEGNDPIEVGALEGFQDFFIDQNGNGNPNTCADSNAGCHELPLGTATNSETLQAFDAPTLRGMTDRFLQFSLGPAHTEELLAFANAGLPSFNISPLEPPIQWDPGQGPREVTTFGAAFAVFEPVYGVRPLDIFQMFEEASTGPSGALGRQVTLNARTTDTALLAETEALLAELEAADERGVVNLRGAGLRDGQAVALSYLQSGGVYKVGGETLSRGDLIREAQPPQPTLIVTLTGHLRSGVSEDSPQPLIAPFGAQCDTGPNTPDPLLPAGSSFPFEGAHVAHGDAVFLNGQDTGLQVSVTGTSSSCSPTQGQITTQLLSVSGLVRTGGTDLLQIRSANGLLSNEMPLLP